MLDERQIQKYKFEGYLHVENLIPLNLIETIKDQIFNMIIDQSDSQKIVSKEPRDISKLDHLYLKLKDDPFTRNKSSFVYDGAKKIPIVAQLSSSQLFEDLAKTLIGSNRVGFAPRGYGFRIDTPHDNTHKTPLHQDFHTNLGSTDGITFYAPLFSLDISTGPLIVYEGSHSLGLLRVKKSNKTNESTDLLPVISDIDLQKFNSVQPIIKAGDILAINNLTLHQSGNNNGSHSRWTLISRWFNLGDSGAISRGYKCGVNDGFKFEDVHPEFFDEAM